MSWFITRNNPSTSQTDRWTDDMQSQDRALYCSASCGKKHSTVLCVMSSCTQHSAVLKNAHLLDKWPYMYNVKYARFWITHKAIFHRLTEVGWHTKPRPYFLIYGVNLCILVYQYLPVSNTGHLLLDIRYAFRVSSSKNSCIINNNFASSIFSSTVTISEQSSIPSRSLMASRYSNKQTYR